MDELKNKQEYSPVLLSNNKNHAPNTTISDNSHFTTDAQFASYDNFDSPKTNTQNRQNYTTQNNLSENINDTMSRLSMHETRSANRSQPNRFRPNHSYYHNVRPPSYFAPGHVNQPEAQAQLVAFTPPLMSIQLPYPNYQNYEQSYDSSRPSMQHYPHEQSSLSMKSKSETTSSQPEYYVDSFASNFSDKPSSNSTNKLKAKHVTFQEPETAKETVQTPIDNNPYSVAPMQMYPTYRHYNPNSYHPMYNQFHGQYSNAMMNSRMMTTPRGMNTMPVAPVWQAQSYSCNPRLASGQPRLQTRYLYDPNKPKHPTTSSPQSNTAKVIRTIEPKQKKKPKSQNHTDNSTTQNSDPKPQQITILRKPNTESEIMRASMVSSPTFTIVRPTSSSLEEQIQDISSNAVSDTLKPILSDSVSNNDESLSSSVEIPSEVPSTENKIVALSQSVSNTNLSFSSHELLSILQSANCISSLNEYAQQKKFTINYEFSSTSSSSSFTCTVSINGRQFPTSAPCSSKTEAQKLAYDQALRILYQESCNIEKSSVKFSHEHDYIVHRSLTAFQELNVNELLLGRKTLACMLMITGGQYDQARVISIATGNSCLDETNLQYADDGTTLHDCHAEILARRGLIRFLFEEIKQSKDKKTSIFEYNSIINKYELNKNVTFHMYISSLPCGNAFFNIRSNSIRYKQGQIEGTKLPSTDSDKYPIKSCSDKIYRWNILGIQGGLLISLLLRPIYLETITFACETTVDRNHLIYSLCERLNEHLNSLPSPFICNLPDIDCPKTKSFQQDRQVAKLQTSAFAWNITNPDRVELLEPITGRLKNDRSMSSLSKRKFFEDFTNFIQTNFPDDDSLSFKTYQEAKRLNKTYVKVKDLISTAFGNGSTDANIPWISKSDQLEQFSME